MSATFIAPTTNVEVANRPRPADVILNALMDAEDGIVLIRRLVDERKGEFQNPFGYTNRDCAETADCYAALLHEIGRVAGAVIDAVANAGGYEVEISQKIADGVIEEAIDEHLITPFANLASNLDVTTNGWTKQRDEYARRLSILAREPA